MACSTSCSSQIALSGNVVQLRAISKAFSALCLAKNDEAARATYIRAFDLFFGDSGTLQCSLSAVRTREELASQYDKSGGERVLTLLLSSSGRFFDFDADFDICVSPV